MTPHAAIQSILFVASKPLTVAELSKAVKMPSSEVEAGLKTLETQLAESGLSLISNEGKYSLGTSTTGAELVRAFLHTEQNGELTRPALETLTIVAYRGPVTKPEIEQIRGVNCSLILRNLLVRGLVEEGKDEKGELTYSVTHAFLAHLGLTSTSSLQDYEALRNHPELVKALQELKTTPGSEIKPVVA